MKEYIEREALLEEDFTYKCINIDDISVIEKLIKNVPTADVAPVVHGEWINHNTYVECPLCGAMPYHRSAYCPNCGAKMDGGK